MSHDPKNDSRRDFLKLTGLTLLAGVTAGKALQSSTANAQGTKPGALEMVKPTDPQAVALGYHEDASKVDTKKWPKRVGPEGAKQFCWNCQFYQAKSDNPKSVTTASCTIFANKGVKGAGWCNSWVQNPKAKA